MGGTTEVLKARTKKELEQKVREWVRDRKDGGMEWIRAGWDPHGAEKTEDGWEITVSAHT